MTEESSSLPNPKPRRFLWKDHSIGLRIFMVVGTTIEVLLLALNILQSSMTYTLILTWYIGPFIITSLIWYRREYARWQKNVDVDDLDASGGMKRRIVILLAVIVALVVGYLFGAKIW